MSRSNLPNLSRGDIYVLIINQLMQDGFAEAAANVARVSQTVVEQASENGARLPHIDKDRLKTLLELGLRFEANVNDSETSIYTSNAPDDDTSDLERQLPGINLDEEDTTEILSDYTTLYVANHKNACVVCAFSNNGKLMSTGSADHSIKLLDVTAMRAFGDNAFVDNSSRPKPTLRSFYDHTDVISGIHFHPNSRTMASCSRDKTIRLFDVVGGAKRAHHVITDAHAVNSIAFHPRGDFLLAGADGPVRLYDLTHDACYKARGAASVHHSGAVLSVAWADDARSYATAGADGALKLWDGVSQQVAATLVSGGGSSSAVLSAQWSRSGRYLLSAGARGTATVWDVRQQKPLLSVGTASTSAAGRGAVWSHDERLVVLPDAGTSHVGLYATRGGARVGQLGGHSAPVITVAASPIEPALCTGSLDMRARFWLLDHSAMLV